MDEKMKTNVYSFCLVLAVIAAFAQPAFCGRGYVLLIDQSPIEGGIVTPGVGVHNFGIGEKVQLTAVPKPGYQFVRWMGDVSSSDASRTVVTLDAPKMLVAVFEKTEFALPYAAEDLGAAEAQSNNQAPGNYGGGRGGQTAQSQYFGGGGGISPASGEYSQGDTNYIVNQVPEPATMALLGIGAVIGLLRRRI
jgi:hypothetical protein